MLKKIILFTFAVLGSIFGEWNPIYLRKNLDLTPLKNPTYEQLKNRVTHSLQNTWCSAEKATLIMDLIVLEKPKVCVEIGVFMGWSFLPMGVAVQYLKEGKVYGIDPWSNLEAIKNLDKNDPNRAWLASLNMNEISMQAKAMLRQWKLNSVCKLYTAPSNQCASHFTNINFLHIDGNYSEESSIEDVLHYLPKVSIGGYILYSGLSWVVFGKMPRVKAFQMLLDYCEIVATLDNHNVILLRKIFD